MRRYSGWKTIRLSKSASMTYFDPEPFPFVWKEGHLYHLVECQRAVSPKQKDAQAKRIQTELKAHLSGGTRLVPGISGKEKIGQIVKRLQSLKVRGRKALIRNLGEERVRKMELEAKTGFIKSYLSMRKGLTTTKEPTKKELAQIPEDIRREAGLRAGKSDFIQEREGFIRWEEESGRRVWRDEKGHYSKGPRK